MHRVRKDPIDHRARKHSAVVRKPVVVIHIGLMIQPVNGRLILLSRRPHSEDMRVEEVFHRIDRDRMELTMTINDPKVYEKPWIALNKLQFILKPANTELLEMMCSPSELAEYNRRHASRAISK